MGRGGDTGDGLNTSPGRKSNRQKNFDWMWDRLFWPGGRDNKWSPLTDPRQFVLVYREDIWGIFKTEKAAMEFASLPAI